MDEKHYEKKRRKLGFLNHDRMGLSSPWWQSVLALMILGALAFGCFEVGWTLGSWLRFEKDRAAWISASEEAMSEVENDSVEEAEITNDTEKSSGEQKQQLAEEYIKPEPISQPEVTGKKLVALTFDDGPSRATTSRLLDILREKQVQVTFFVLGNMVQRSPDLLQREVAEGHQVGSHTMAHTSFRKMDLAGLQADVAAMNQLFSSNIGMNTPFIRPPYGDLAYSEMAKVGAGQPIILWSVDTRDWESRNAEAVRANVAKDSFDGAIILMHDLYDSTVDAVSGVIDDLRAQGYEFLTVSELAKARGVTMQNGVVYGSFR